MIQLISNQSQDTLPEILIQPKYWEQLRRDIFPLESVGECLCFFWCKRVLKSLDSSGFVSYFTERIQKKHLLLKKNRLNSHRWLESLTQDRFIADGTAGQLTEDSQYGRGFYGFIEQAPEGLKQSYKSLPPLKLPAQAT